MVKLLYKGNKWDKEVGNVKKLKKAIKGNLYRNKETNIHDFIELGGNDYLRLYFLLRGDYAELARLLYLDDVETKTIVKYGYLSGVAALLSMYLYKFGVNSNTYNNGIIANMLEQEKDYIIFRMLSVGVLPNTLLNMERDNLIICMYLKDYEHARLLLDEISDNLDESREIYFDSPVFLKKIYLAIIEKNEKDFNEALVERIRKYRTNMVGYSIIIDYVSIALIKLAEREGIHCNVDVIEIPKQFFDKELLGKLDIHELPYFDECLKTGMLDGFKWD